MGRRFQFKKRFSSKGTKIYNNFIKLDEAFRQKYKDKSIYQIPFAELVQFVQNELKCSKTTARQYAYVIFVLKV